MLLPPHPARVKSHSSLRPILQVSFTGKHFFEPSVRDNLFLFLIHIEFCFYLIIYNSDSHTFLTMRLTFRYLLKISKLGPITDLLNESLQGRNLGRSILNKTPQVTPLIREGKYLRVICHSNWPWAGSVGRLSGCLLEMQTLGPSSTLNQDLPYNKIQVIPKLEKHCLTILFTCLSVAQGALW